MSRCCTRLSLKALAAAGVLALTVASTGASAALVSYRFTGSFSGLNTGDAALRAAIAPQIGTQTVSIDVTLDTAASAAPRLPTGSIFRAITAASYSFAGFDAVNSPCSSTGDFNCTAHVADGTSVLVGGSGNLYHLFPSFARSTAFETAVGEARELTLQMNLFFDDIFDQVQGAVGVDLDLTATPLSRWDGGLTVFALGGNGFDRADFDFDITRIVNLSVGTGELPEPGSAMLVAAGLAGLALRRRRRPA